RRRGIIILGAAGLSAPGTLYAAMTAQVKAKQTLLPLLLFPLIVPALLSSVKATSLVILGDPMQSLRSWMLLLGAFDAIYWSLCGLLYPRVIEDGGWRTSTTIDFRERRTSCSRSVRRCICSAATGDCLSRQKSSSW